MLHFGFTAKGRCFVFANKKGDFLNFQTNCTLCDVDRVNIVIYATVFVCVNEKDLFAICCWNFF